MKKKYDVSVIICTYNSQWNKLKSTISSILEQKNKKYEIIITDDGSTDTNFDKVNKLLERFNFRSYNLISHNVNQGIVENYYSALIAAQGEYVYGIAPGDMLYDDKVLCNLHNFAKKNNASVCFGNAVYYNVISEGVKVFYDVKNAPSRPWLYDSDLPIEKIKEYFFMGNIINGASFFRRTEIAIKYVDRIRGISKYVEDNTTTALLLADGIRVWHYDDFTVWYEYGTGVSTGNDSKWKKLLENDFNKVNSMLLQEYPNDKTIRDLIKINSMNKELPKYLYMLFKCPGMIFKRKAFKKQKESIGYNKPVDESLLKKYLGMGDA